MLISFLTYWQSNDLGTHITTYNETYEEKEKAYVAVLPCTDQ